MPKLVSSWPSDVYRASAGLVSEDALIVPPVLVAPDEGGIFDDEGEAIALDESDDDIGALGEDDAFSGDPSLREEMSERGQGRSPEEAAMHIEGDGDPLPDDLP